MQTTLDVHIDMILDNIRRVRVIKGLSVSALARKCGMQQPTLYRLETREARMTLAQYLAICNALNVCPGDMIEPNFARGLELCGD